MFEGRKSARSGGGDSMGLQLGAARGDEDMELI